eukprot:GHVQ01013385.1.p1 GENE.GHVQ01013385.1~~GHVQ01013385.1.p1  ORF type:complete len:394 (-),score=41.09 GHVQ01013385.1:137-1318(-)
MSLPLIANGHSKGSPPIGEGSSSNSIFAQKYHQLRDELLSEVEELGVSAALSKEMTSYYRRFLDHSVSGGKMTRGLTVVKALEASWHSKPDDIGAGSGGNHVSEQPCSKLEEMDEHRQLEHAMVLGWCVEWLQAFFLTADDVMDHSHTRRGVPCWFRVEGVTASNAINDALYLNCCIYRIMKRHLGDRSDYSSLVEIMHDMTMKTVIGQHLDTNAQPLDNDVVDVSRITMDRYKAIVRHKTAYYSFYLPAVLGMTIGGIKDPILFVQAKELCMAIGEYFQIQDDVLDCFADAAVLGKVGTDIEEKKCSWLAVQALSMSTEEEIEQFKQNYGSKDASKVQWVKGLYRKYELKAKYDAYEEETVANIKQIISQVKHEGLVSLFSFLVNKLYKREK